MAIGPSGDIYHSDGGMTLRDYFAGQALIGLSGNPGNAKDLDEVAWATYQMADAMIVERGKED